MCLERITKRYAEPDMKVRTAYKIVQKDNKTPFLFFTLIPNAWMEANERQAHTEARSLGGWDRQKETYISGFHVFPTRAAARKALSLLSTRVNRVIRKVEVKGITYEGTDGTGYQFTEWNIPNLVAQWIRLLPGKV